MTPSDNIKKLFKETNIKTNPETDKLVLDDAVKAMSESKNRTLVTTRPDVWRIIMQSRITKFATVAVLAIAVLLSITFLDKTVPTAYALEQTFAAMEKVKTVHMRCRDWYNNKYEMWIQLDPKTGIPEYCRAYWPKTKILNLSTPDKSYQYNEGAHQVQVNSGKLYNIPVAPSKIFEQLVRGAKMKSLEFEVQIKNELDSETGKTVIVAITNTPNDSWKILIDPETKLPLELHCLKNSNKMGAFFKDIDKIEFDVELPPDIFKFEIPEGARIIDHDRNNRLLMDTRYGMLTKGMTENEAYKKIATDYWNAMIRGDVDEAKKISPLTPENIDGSLFAEVVEVDNPYVEPGCGIGKLVPCKIRYKDGSLKMWKLVVKKKEKEGEMAIVIAGCFDSPKEL